MHLHRSARLLRAALAGGLVLASAACERHGDEVGNNPQSQAGPSISTPTSIAPPAASPPPPAPSTMAPPVTQAPPERATTPPPSAPRVTQMPTPELQKTPTDGKPSAKPSDTPAQGGQGQRVYVASCAACHDRGVSGAPKLGDKADWAPRIAQGQAVLITHAKNGFAGKRGFMPPKGGNAALTDAELAAAVSYMVQQSQ